MRELFECREKLDKDVMSNFDRKINYEIAEKLKTELYFANYPAWDFHAKVTFNDGKYVAEVWQYCNISGYVFSDTIEKLMEECSYEYGYE